MARSARKDIEEILSSADEIMEALGVHPHDHDMVRKYIEEMLLQGYNAEDIISEIRLVSHEQLVYEQYLTEPAQDILVEAITGRSSQ